MCKDFSFRILASSDEEAAFMETMAEASGMSVKGSVVFDGPVPPNSYRWLTPMIRVSTPEFFLYRKVLTNEFEDALTYVCEMFSRVCTSLTSWSMPDGVYEESEKPATSLEAMDAYLAPMVGVLPDDELDAILSLMDFVVAHNVVGAYESVVREMLAKAD